MATIQSSIFSFVDFNAGPDACNDQQMALPAVNDFGIKFQFKLLNINTGIIPWAAPVVNGNPVLGAKTLCDSQCGRLTFPIPFSAYPITISGTGTLPLFDNGTYNTPELLLANLQSKNEYDWKIDDTHIYADSCCIPPYVGTIEVTGADSYVLDSQLMLDYIYFFANVPAVNMGVQVNLGECFTYGIYEQDPSFNPASLISASNSFKRMEPGCFLTKVEYWSEHNAYDFNYTCASHNTAWLPIYLTNPTNPTSESVYVESTGRRRVLSASLDEEFVLKTDHLTQWLHRKIEGMLLHDFKLFTNSYYGLVAESLTKNGPYEKAWNEETAYIPTATAKTKLIKNLSYFNSGCCDVEMECCPPEELECAQVSGLQMETFRDGINWGVNITACTYLSPPTVPQNVEIYYRERYSLGAFTLAGTIDFDISGNIISIPSPFVISGLSDLWQEVEIKAVNLCGSDDFFTHINNPCETMAGIIAHAEEDSSGIVPGWKVVITDVVYSNWPAFGVNKTIDVSAREYGTMGAFSPIVTFDLVVNAGYVVTLTPNPVEVGIFDSDWERVELKLEYGCEKEFIQVFSNPLADCVAVSEVDVIDITETTADATWPAVSPTPSGFYDWELRDGITNLVIDSGTGYWNPGTLVLALTGMISGHLYRFRVRCNCGDDSYSVWADTFFQTI